MSRFEEHSIPKRIRDLRKNLNMTLEELSKKVDFTVAYLSKMERSKKAPPISTLYKISEALNVDFNYIITGNNNKYSNERISFVPKEERLCVLKDKSEFGYNYFALAYKKSNKLMEPFLLEISNEGQSTPFSHNGEELSFILKGRVNVFVDGTIYEMTEGDTIYYDSTLPHYFVRIGDEKAYILQINSEKKYMVNPETAK